MDSWLGNRRRIIVMNREDMVSADDRNAWATYFSSQGIKVIYSNGQLGMVRQQLCNLCCQLVRYILAYVLMQYITFPFVVRVR